MLRTPAPFSAGHLSSGTGFDGEHRGFNTFGGRSHSESFDARVAGGRPILWLDGAHDHATQRSDAELLARAIATADADVVVDLSGVEFIGLATIDLLVRGRDYLLSRSRRLTLRSPSPTTLRLIEWRGLGVRLAVELG